MLFLFNRLKKEIKMSVAELTKNTDESPVIKVIRFEPDLDFRHTGGYGVFDPEEAIIVFIDEKGRERKLQSHHPIEDGRMSRSRRCAPLIVQFREDGKITITGRHVSDTGCTRVVGSAPEATATSRDPVTLNDFRLVKALCEGKFGRLQTEERKRNTSFKGTLDLTPGGIKKARAKAEQHIRTIQSFLPTASKA
jgi:hypothetical protein